MDDLLPKLVAQSPVAVAVLVFGALARRWLEPFVRDLWAQWREERKSDRAKADERTAALHAQAAATHEAAAASNRLADALHEIRARGLAIDTTKNNGKAPHG